jgi:hypothetical protein
MSLKRYNLVLPAELYAEVEQLAKREHTSVLEILRRCIRLGLFVSKAKNATLIVSENGRERTIIFI